MDDFLISTKSALESLSRYDIIKVVLGNPTCDLDSATSALVLAYFYHKRLSDGERKIAVIPVLNIKEREFVARTEVAWFFRENGIEKSHLTFRDQINLVTLSEEKKLDLILVDHHTLSREDAKFSDRVSEIIDHRPRDPDWPWPRASLRIEPVGSCATLIAEKFFKEAPEWLDAKISILLAGTILVDTQNLSETAGRAKPLDYQIIARLEESPRGVGKLDRKRLYDGILTAKTDISSLTGRDLLEKDLKIVGDIAVPALPILVQNFLTIPDARGHSLSFRVEGNWRFVLILGMDLQGAVERRDLALVGPRTSEMESLIASLKNSELDILFLKEEHFEEENSVLLLFEQRNVRATRKQVIPIVRQTFAEEISNKIDTKNTASKKTACV